MAKSKKSEVPDHFPEDPEEPDDPVTPEETPETKPSEKESRAEEKGRDVPIVESDFSGLLSKYGLKKERAAIIAENIAQTGGANVFEDPQRLLERLNYWSSDINPARRAQLLQHWFAQRSIPVPTELVELAGKSRVEMEKEGEKKQQQAAKFFFDDQTGLVRGAKTGENPLTWDEATMVADRWKSVRTAGSEPGKEGAPAPKKEKFFVDADGSIRSAREGEMALTLDEATMVADRIKKDRQASHAAEEGEPPKFLPREDGQGYVLNPNAKLTATDIVVFQAMKKAEERGEQLSPEQAMMAKKAEWETMQQMFGGGGKGSFGEMIDTMAKFKQVFGGEDDTKKLLAALIQRQEETGKQRESEDVRLVREQLAAVQRTLEEERRNRIEQQLNALAEQNSQLRQALMDARNQSSARSEFDIMGQLIGVLDKRFGAAETLAQGFLGRPPAKMPAGAREALKAGINEQITLEKGVDDLARRTFFAGGKQPPAASGGVPAAPPTPPAAPSAEVASPLPPPPRPNP